MGDGAKSAPRRPLTVLATRVHPGKAAMTPVVAVLLKMSARVASPVAKTEALIKAVVGAARQMACQDEPRGVPSVRAALRQAYRR